ncbi:hypothetical protein PIROE2DRAFT_11550 [Piromyces sp. E2]|nr:hypothetical protein PIROE2DRAFT_11550 [Piromyces sp. E2]|eukprot:OUM62233.1 hypothetical protein PIROE2DRAFT_11550 [Piromyces sp. E2]
MNDKNIIDEYRSYHNKTLKSKFIIIYTLLIFELNDTNEDDYPVFYVSMKASDEEFEEDYEKVMKTGKTGIGAGAVIAIIISILFGLMYCASFIIFCCMFGKFKKFREQHLVEVDEQGEPIGGYNAVNTNNTVQATQPYYNGGMNTVQTSQPYYNGNINTVQTPQPYYNGNVNTVPMVQKQESAMAVSANAPQEYKIQIDPNTTQPIVEPPYPRS